MKKVIPFTKKITFKTMISEVTNITIKHNLELKETNELEGDILVDGKYKMTDASIVEEEFHYKLPFVIAIDSKYDTSKLEVSISDFNFEIINEEVLKINVEIELDNLEELENIRNDIKIPIEIDETVEKVDFDEDPLDKLEKEIKEDKVNETNINKLDNTKSSVENANIGSIFSSLTSNEETFSTYHVYIVRESDTIEGILDKYNISREELADYNDMDDIKLGTKLIIPCPHD